MGDYFVEYQFYGPDFREAIIFKDFCQLNGNNRSRGQSGGGYEHGIDLQRMMGRLFLPNFDGSPKSSTRAWVEKLDVYFQLNEMTELDELTISTLHLEREAHDWWFHGLTTMGHAGVTTYKDFTRRVLENFKRRDPKEHFGEMT